MNFFDADMKSRKVNSARNFVFGIGSFFLNTLLSFVARTVFIGILSSDYLGVSSLFTNIITILSLAELGSGGVFAALLYKPLCEHDEDEIASIVAALKKIYIIIGCFVATAGLCFLPFLGFFTGETSAENIELIYLIFLSGNSIGYFFGYGGILISADQKNYIFTAYSQFFSILRYVLQIVVLLVTHDFIIYWCIQTFSSVCASIAVTARARKLYPYITTKAKHISKELSAQIRKMIGGGLCMRVGGVIADGTDSVVISHFLGLAVLGVYSNYLLIIGTIASLASIANSAVQASIGNMAVSSDAETNYSFFKKMNFFSFMMTGLFGTCLITLLNPFIERWAGSGYLMEMSAVIPAVLLYMTGSGGIKTPLLMYRNVNGLFYLDKYVSLFEGILNLTLSLILVRKIGIVGVFIGTIVSSFCTTISSSYIVFGNIFSRPVWEYWKSFFIYGGAITAVGMFAYWVSNLLPHISYSQIFIMAIVCGCTTLAGYVLIFFPTEEFHYFAELILRILRRKKQSE